MNFLNLGQIRFQDALTIQDQMVQEIRFGRREETVLIVEHPPVFTLGRSGRAENLLSRLDFEGRPVELVKTNRGGDITFHGPGQLVAYPHLDLRRRGRDVHQYLRRLEELLIRLAAVYGVTAFRREGLTGVWTSQGKLASIGVGVRHWVTMHGLALNVVNDLRYFSLMNPCGMPRCRITSLSRLCKGEVALEEVTVRFRQSFEEVFEPTPWSRASVRGAV